MEYLHEIKTQTVEKHPLAILREEMQFLGKKCSGTWGKLQTRVTGFCSQWPQGLCLVGLPNRVIPFVWWVDLPNTSCHLLYTPTALCSGWSQPKSIASWATGEWVDQGAVLSQALDSGLQGRCQDARQKTLETAIKTQSAISPTCGWLTPITWLYFLLLMGFSNLHLLWLRQQTLLARKGAWLWWAVHFKTRLELAYTGKSWRWLQNIPLHCVKMCHCGWFNKELCRKRLGRASGDRKERQRGRKAGCQPDTEKAGWAVQS